MANHGFVYLLGNKEMPGLIKVGMTNRSPYLRASELSSPTGVPAKFELLAFFACENPQGYERRIHEYLSDYRLHGKEFFRCRLVDVYFPVEGLLSVITPVGIDRFSDEMADWIEDMQPPLEEHCLFCDILTKKDYSYVDGWISRKTGINFSGYLEQFYLDKDYQ